MKANSNDQVVVAVEPRDTRGKNACRRMRSAGRVPGNVYGMNLPPFAVSVDPRRIEEVLHTSTGRNTIFQLSLGDQEETRVAMFRELQRDPVNEHLVHVDFVRIDTEKQLHVTVPVRLIGTPTGVKNEGGLLDFVHRRVEVSCLPWAIPEHLDVDVSELHINQNVAVKELRLEQGVEILDDPETILAVVASPRVEVEAAAAEEAEAAAEAETAEEGDAAAKEQDKPEEGGEKK